METMNSNLRKTKGGYNFSPETWRIIEDFEKSLRESKKRKKDEEVRMLLSWFTEVESTRNFQKLVEGRNFLYKTKGYQDKYKKQFEKNISNEIYVGTQLGRILKKNKFYLEKVSQSGLRFSLKDVRLTCILATLAKEQGIIYDFFAIPDVFFIMNNIRDNYDKIINGKIDISCY